MLTTQDYPKLTQKLNEWYNEAASASIEEWKGRQVFDVRDTDWKTYDYLALHGTGGFTRVAEGSQLPGVTSNEGDSASWTQKRYGSRIVVTKDMRMFDRYDQMEEIVRSEVDFAFNQIDQSQADILTNGFTGSSFTDVFGDTQSNLAVDGVVLFSASHTNNINSNTFRNLIRDSAGTANPGLDRDAIVQACTDAMNYKDPNGANRPTYLDMLIVGSKQSDLAERLVFSNGVQGTPNIDINPVKNKVREVLTWSKIDNRSDSTDTSDYWFMADKRKVGTSLKTIFAQKPMMGEADNVNDSLNWEYPVDAYFVHGLGYPVGIFGSTGANN